MEGDTWGRELICSSGRLEVVALDSQDTAELSVVVCQLGSGEEQETFRAAWGITCACEPYDMVAGSPGGP